MALAVREFRARGYRSLKSIAYPMSGIEVFVGANGVGKSNLYKALELLQSAARNTLADDIARGGGLQASHWAGELRRGEEREIRLEVGLADPAVHREGSVYKYEVVVGFPPRDTGAFAFEPQIREETISHVGGKRPYPLVERRNHMVKVRDDGLWETLDIDLLGSETVLGRLEDPERYVELDAIRRTLLQWRFYHTLRTDPDSPLRRSCPAVAAPTLASDGSNLAAVFATLQHIAGDFADVRDAVGQAFPGALLQSFAPDRSAHFGMTFPEFPKRLFEAEELSDGTLRFLALAGALLSYRLPPFIALNEPESSLHPDLMQPLAGMIARAAKRTQVWLVTHSTLLANAVADQGRGKVRTVVKQDGETRIEGLTRWGEFEEE